MRSIKLMAFLFVHVAFLAFCGCKNTSGMFLDRLNEYAVKIQATVNIDENIAIIASGFAVDKDYLATAGHFCLEMIANLVQFSNIELHFINAEKKEVIVNDIEFFYISDSFDLCFIKRKNHGVNIVNVDDTSKYKIGDIYVVVGAPHGWFPVETSGKFIEETLKEIAISAPTSLGNSGSPVFNDEGLVVGMVIKVLGGYRHISFALKSNIILQEFKKIDGK